MALLNRQWAVKQSSAPTGGEAGLGGALSAVLSQLCATAQRRLCWDTAEELPTLLLGVTVAGLRVR